jgi:hypothetical protein
MSELVNKWVEGIIEDLRKEYVQQGRKASGNWGRELESKVEESVSSINIKILAPEYTGAFEFGRAKSSGGVKGQGKLKDIIEKWIEDKNIAYSGITKKGLAFVIARKIHREGIKVPNNYNKGGLVTGVITDKKIAELGKSLQGMYVASIKSDLIKQWQSQQ